MKKGKKYVIRVYEKLPKQVISVSRGNGKEYWSYDPVGYTDREQLWCEARLALDGVTEPQLAPGPPFVFLFVKVHNGIQDWHI